MNTTAKQILKYVEKLPDEMQKEALDFIHCLKKQSGNDEKKPEKVEPSGTRLARLMQEVSSKNLFSHIKDPTVWQRAIRKDSPLPGRDE